MGVEPVLQWIAFGLFAFIAIAGALGMTTTMSMFRSGIFLMASFIGVAGLFVLLLADLLAWLQVMMYIGGMLVMILFMVLFGHDPGGSMMTSMMPLRGPEWLFSLGLRHGDGTGHGEGMDHGEASMAEMSMFTPIKKPAAVLAGLVGALLVALLLWRPSFAVVLQLPDQDSPRRIGHLLMSKYMIAFEGAGLLILLGIFGAVMVSRPGRHPDPSDRQRLQAAVAEGPAPIQTDLVDPVYGGLHAEVRPGRPHGPDREASPEHRCEPEHRRDGEGPRRS